MRRCRRCCTRSSPERCKLLTRRGVLVEEQGSTYMADIDGDSEEARALRPLQAAACTYRIAFGPRAGQKVLTQQGALPRDADFKQNLCADSSGFSLHAAVRCGADDCQALEQLCRYITRPALANERVQTNAAGQVVLKLKTAWRDGTTHLVMSPLEFMQRLAALVPRPRLHLIRFGVRVTSLREVSGPALRDHGVLAPNAKLRAQVVPQEPEPPTQAAPRAECEANCAHHRPVRLSWAKLLKRGFELDLEHCPNCGGELKIIAAILRGEPGRKRSRGPFAPGERQGLCALAAGDREDPLASWAAGPGTAARACPWVAAASGLTLTQALRPSGAAARAEAYGCARGSPGPIEAA